MAQRHYSARTVEKLKAQLQLAEQNFGETLAANERLSEQLDTLRGTKQEYENLWNKAMHRNAQLEEEIKILTGKKQARDLCMAEVNQGACERAHAELHKVKATEQNKEILQRAIGNAQGILAAALDANGARPTSLCLYPDEDKVESVGYGYGAGGGGGGGRF